MAETKETIGGYKLRGQIANTGQSSQVFEVIEPASFRHFAMKILLPEHVKKADKRRELFHEASVGIKMLLSDFVHLPALVSLGIILFVLAGAISFSLAADRRDARTAGSN